MNNCDVNKTKYNKNELISRHNLLVDPKVTFSWPVDSFKGKARIYYSSSWLKIDNLYYPGGTPL